MNFFQQYAKEIFSIVVPIVTWILNNKFKARAKLHIAAPHSFIFLVQEPMRNAEGEVIRPNQTVHTVSHVITNAGKETATNVELVFNFKPHCLNIWPSRHYTEHVEPDLRYVMVFESLAPSEQIGFELLNINNDLPALINARSDQCTATTVAMYPQPVIPSWKKRTFNLLQFLGLSFGIYLFIVCLQILIFSGK